MQVGDIVRVCYPEEIVRNQWKAVERYHDKTGCILRKDSSGDRPFSVLELNGKEKAFWDDHLVSVFVPMSGADEYEDILAGQALMEGS